MGFVEEVFFDIKVVLVLGLCDSGVVLCVCLDVYYEDGFFELIGVGVKLYLFKVVVVVGDFVWFRIKVSDVMFFMMCLCGILVLNVIEGVVVEVYDG